MKVTVKDMVLSTRANNTQGHVVNWWAWVNVDTALETNILIRTILS